MTGDFPRHSAVIVSESAEMGRKVKYLTESAKKKAKREKRTVGLQKSIYLGKAFRNLCITRFSNSYFYKVCSGAMYLFFTV